AALIATDPPYLVSYDGTNHPGTKKPPKRSVLNAATSNASQRTRSIKGKDWSDTYGVTWDDADGNEELYAKFIALAAAEAVMPSAAWYVWHASRRQAMLEQALSASGIAVHCQIIWAKNRPVLTRTWYAWKHEPCLMGWMKPPRGKKPRRVEKNVLSTLWELDT